MLPVISPADGEAYDQIARGTAHEIDLAVAAARHALDRGAWGRMNAPRMVVHVTDALRSSACSAVFSAV